MKIYPERAEGITVVLGDGTEVAMSATVVDNVHRLAIDLSGDLCAQVYGKRRLKTLTNSDNTVLHITKRKVQS